MKKIYTIGFTKKTAREFFGILEANSIELVADIRLNNTSQLAGFTKGRDLAYFLRLVTISYEYWQRFAPTKEILKRYKEDGDWNVYERAYRNYILSSGFIDNEVITKILNNNVCLLCSEATPENCHRRLLAEMIRDKIGDIEIIHI
ncbi:DUF488 domain-containing protein [bacterium]|nr:DUF488 domain-containing protein [bacterium]